MKKSELKKLIKEVINERNVEQHQKIIKFKKEWDKIRHSIDTHKKELRQLGFPV